MSAILQDKELQKCFRYMTDEDIDAVLAIEESVYPFPWTRGIFTDCLAIGYLCRILEIDNRIVAYSIMSVAAEESHLLTIVVPSEEQGKGYGKIMLNEMIRLAKIGVAGIMYLEVRVSNKIAIALYHQRGFNELGVRKNYYPAENGREDALILALDLSLE